MRPKFLLLAVLVLAGAWGWSRHGAHASAHTVRIETRAPMEDIGYEISDAFATLNRIRTAMNMAPLEANAALARAAQFHADYLVRHRTASHLEYSTRKGFKGSKPIDRALRAGYRARFVGENLSTKSANARTSIDGLFSAIYHRFGFLDPSFDTVGIGIAQEKIHPLNSAFVYLMGNSEIDRLCGSTAYRGTGRYVYGVCADTRHRIRAQTYQQARRAVQERNPRIVVYPYDGQTNVPPAFYNENPDPLPGYDVSGFPVSIAFNPRYFRTIKLIDFRLFRSDGSEVTSVQLRNKQNDPNHELSRRQFALMPLKRLAYGATYRVMVNYRHRKKHKQKVWTFTVRKPTEALKIIRNKKQTLTLKRGRGYWLYFPPHNRHDVLGAMRYPADVFVRFIDPNTMRVVLPPNRRSGFEISGSGRRIRIAVQ